MSQRIIYIISCTQIQDKTLHKYCQRGFDVEKLATILLDPEIGNFDLVETFVNRPAQELRDQLEELFKFRKPYDLICLYYCGLGIVDDSGEVFLAAEDSDRCSPAESAIPATELNFWMDNSFSRQQILIFDSNFITFDLAKGRLMVENDRIIEETFRGKGYWRLVLGSTPTTSQLRPAKRRAEYQPMFTFSDFIIRGLETGEADMEGDGLIGTRELYAYLNRTMKKQLVDQKPFLHAYQEKEDFVLARTVTVARTSRRIKWDVLSGAITLPIAILVLGGRANLIISIEAAVIFVLFYAALYRYGD